MLPACLLALASVAGYPEPEGLLHLRITEIQSRAHTEQLNLDLAAQRIRAGRAFERYDVDFGGALDAYKDAVSWLDAVSPGAYDARDEDFYEAYYFPDLHAIDKLWHEEARRLERRYFSELAAIDDVLTEKVESLRRTTFRRRVLRTIELYEGRPAGAKLDVIALVEEIGVRNAPEVASQVDAYGSALDVLLREIDRRLWRRNYDTKLRLRAVREAARHGSEAEIARSIDAAIEILIALPELYHAIRALNDETVESLAAVLPPPAARELRDQASRRIHPFMYESVRDGPARPETLIRAALRRPDLADGQHEALVTIRAELEVARAGALPEVEARYARLVSPDSHREDSRIWLDNLVTWWQTGEHAEYEDLMGSYQQVFDDAVKAWRSRLAVFERRVRAIVGTPEGPQR